MTPRFPRPSRSLFPWFGALALGLSSGCATARADDADRSWRPPHEADLPEGFPAPVEPGLLLLKWYPAYRGAFVRLDGNLKSASWRGFWPLFKHIQREGIEMTAPVLSTYGGDVRTEDRGSMDMAFLYPAARLGTPSPRAEAGVRVADGRALCVVSIGVEGPYDLGTLREATARLDAWLADNAGTWRRAGDVRRLSYQQPLPFKSLYSEVQIPVEPVPLEDRVAGATAGTAPRGP